MKIKGRKNRVIIASLSGIIFSVISLVLSFVLRTYLIKNIGIEYVGLITFLTEIFGLLTALDGGACSSLFIKIHRPIAEKDIFETRSIFRLIKIVYAIRGALVFVVGLIIFFLLPVLTSDLEIPINYIRIAFLIYLVLNSASYLFIYYEFLLEAYQLRFTTNLVTFLVTVFSTMINIVLLFIFKNFLLYLFIVVFAQIISFIICKIIAKKMHKELFDKKSGYRPTNQGEIKDMFKITYYTLSNVVVKNTDNILITKFFGFSVNGIYSTYKMLNTQIFNILGKIKYAVQDSTRNYLVLSDNEKSRDLIYDLTFIYFWIGGFCSICLAVLSTPFIKLWLGADYILTITPVALTVFTLFLEMLVFPMDDAFYSTESYKNNRFVPVVEILINLSVSIVLGVYFGISGIMIGTICYLLYKTIVRGFILFKKTYKLNAISYYLRVLFYSITVCAVFLITYCFCNYLLSLDGIIGFIYQIGICIVFPNIVFFLLFFRTKEFKYFKVVIKELLRKIFRKNVKSNN